MDDKDYGFHGPGLRALVGAAMPPPEDEPPVRDVVGPAMAWGRRRRRRDRLNAGLGAVAAVLAIGAGGLAVGHGGPGAGSPVGGTAAGSCRLPNGAAGSAVFCDLQNRWTDFDTAYARGAESYLAAKLPDGLTVRAADAGPYLVLTDGHTIEYLVLNIQDPRVLLGAAGCREPGCRGEPLAGGTVTLTDTPTRVYAVWQAPAGGPVVSMGLTSDAPRQDQHLVGNLGVLPMAGPSSVPAGITSPPQPTTTPSADVRLLNAARLADLIADPGFQRYTAQQFADYTALYERYLEQMAKELPPIPGGYVSGSIPRIPPSQGAPGTPVAPGTAGGMTGLPAGLPPETSGWSAPPETPTPPPSTGSVWSSGASSVASDPPSSGGTSASG